MTAKFPASVRSAPRLAFRDGTFAAGVRKVPEETAVAISVGGSTHAVMMASPEDVRDLAIGLALNEAIVDNLAEIETIAIETSELGVECRLWLVPDRAATYVARRRQMTGPVGCGLCGVESLELARRAIPVVSGWDAPLEPAAITSAVARMAESQSLGHATRAVHAAAFHAFPGDGVHAPVVREDVGRHNALDKVAGHLAQAGVDPVDGFLTITSRVSVELVQKAARMGCGMIVAVSAPTALAIREAAGAGITLVAVARDEDFEIFTHPGRIAGAAEAAGFADRADDRVTGKRETIHAA